MAAGEVSYLLGPRQSQQEIHGLDWAGGAGAGFWDNVLVLGERTNFTRCCSVQSNCLARDRG